MLYWVYNKLPFRLGKYVAMYACKYREPLHYHHDGCPSCSIYGKFFYYPHDKTSLEDTR